MLNTMEKMELHGGDARERHSGMVLDRIDCLGGYTRPEQMEKESQGKLTNPCSPGKWPLKWCVMCV